MKKRRHPDLPEDLPSQDDDIWQSMGISFDDDDQMAIDSADRQDKERLLAIYREEDREEFQRNQKQKQHEHRIKTRTKGTGP